MKREKYDIETIRGENMDLKAGVAVAAAAIEMGDKRDALRILRNLLAPRAKEATA